MSLCTLLQFNSTGRPVELSCVAINGALLTYLKSAVPCVDVGADVLDQTGQSTETFGRLQADEVSFALSPQQSAYFNTMRHINSYLREEYHTLHEFLWRTGFSASSSSFPKWLAIMNQSVKTRLCGRSVCAKRIRAAYAPGS